MYAYRCRFVCVVYIFTMKQEKFIVITSIMYVGIYIYIVYTVYKLLDDPPNYYAIPDTDEPDVWFEPVQVWEVLCADISISPKYNAAVGQVKTKTKNKNNN